MSIREQLSEERKKLQKEGLVPEWMTTDGWGLFKQKYSVEGEKGFKGRCETISKTLASYTKNPEEWEVKFFNLLWKGWLSASTPVLSNTGTTRGMSISCSGQYVGDSINSFYSNIHESAMLSKYGFGVSGYFGDIRPRGSSVSIGGKASGVLPVFEDFVTMSQKVSQGSNRRGAFAGYLPISHKDFDEIADFVKEYPDSANIGWCWYDSDTEKANSGDIETLRRFKKAMKLKLLTGKGYWFFPDKVNRANPQMYKDLGLSVKSSNLCVAPETLILTDSGYQKISALQNEIVNVWNGKEFSEVIVKKTGENQKLLKVVTNSGFELECTPYHKFYVVQKGATSGETSVFEKRANELEAGDKLLKCNFPIIQGNKTLDFAYTEGFKSAEDCLHNKFFVPNGDYTIESKLQWFSGLCDGEGTVVKNEENQSIQVSSINKNFLLEIQMMLQTLGVSSKMTLCKEEGINLIPENDETGSYANDYTQKAYRLVIGQNGIYTLNSLGFKTYRLKITNHTPNKECTEFVEIEEVIDTGRFDDTYCFTEPKRGMGVFNGILTGQCSEITLHQDEEHSYTCVLSSMNLSHYNEWKNTDAVFDAIVFLDCVVEDFLTKGRKIPGFEKALRFTEKGRALGLGVCGFHTYLQQEMIPFESLTAMFKNKEIFKHIKTEATRATQWLAKEFGEPEWCKGYGVRNTHLMCCPPTLSTSLIMSGVSQGIEPMLGNCFVQDSAGGQSERINPVFLKLMKQRGKYTKKLVKHIADNAGSIQDQDWLTDDEKLVFKTAFEINQESIIRLASQRQPFICQAQSINLFFSAEESEEYIAQIHKAAFQDENIKSLYYIRTQSGVESSKNECLACQ